MYIGHVTDCYLPRLGGIEWQVHDLATRQSAAGHQVEVVTNVPGAGSQGEIPVHRPRGEVGAEAIRYRSARRGSEVALSRGFDVLHVHASTCSPLAYWTVGGATRAGIPVVVTLHSLWSWAAGIYRVGNWVTRWGHLPVQWTAVSAAAARPMQRMLPAGVPVTVLPNGVDREQWLLPPAEAVRVGADGVPEVHVVSTLRFSHRKRPLPLVDMLREARTALDGRVRLRATLVGDGPMRRKVEAALRRCGLDDCVELPGRLERPAIAELFARADLYLAPAELESFGIAALEARCAGLPVLGRAGTGLAEFITPGVDGLLGASDAELVRSLVLLASDVPLRTSIARHNRHQPPRVSWPQILRSCQQLYAAASVSAGRPVPDMGAGAPIPGGRASLGVGGRSRAAQPVRTRAETAGHVLARAETAGHVP